MRPSSLKRANRRSPQCEFLLFLTETKSCPGRRLDVPLRRGALGARAGTRRRAGSRYGLGVGARRRTADRRRTSALGPPAEAVPAELLEAPVGTAPLSGLARGGLGNVSRLRRLFEQLGGQPPERAGSRRWSETSSACRSATPPSMRWLSLDAQRRAGPRPAPLACSRAVLAPGRSRSSAITTSRRSTGRVAEAARRGEARVELQRENGEATARARYFEQHVERTMSVRSSGVRRLRRRRLDLGRSSEGVPAERLPESGTVRGARPARGIRRVEPPGLSRRRPRLSRRSRSCCCGVGDHAHAPGVLGVHDTRSRARSVRHRSIASSGV